MSTTGSATLVNNTFADNTALSASDSGGGGAAAFAGVNASVTSSRVLRNRAQGDGGGLLFQGGLSLTVTDSEVSGNRVTAGSRGAGLAAFDASAVTLMRAVLVRTTQQGRRVAARPSPRGDALLLALPTTKEEKLTRKGARRLPALRRTTTW